MVCSSQRDRPILRAGCRIPGGVAGTRPCAGVRPVTEDLPLRVAAEVRADTVGPRHGGELLGPVAQPHPRQVHQEEFQ